MANSGAPCFRMAGWGEKTTSLRKGERMLIRRMPVSALRRQIQSTSRALPSWLNLKNQYSRGAEGWGSNTYLAWRPSRLG
jgi:hypothetical protein